MLDSESTLNLSDDLVEVRTAIERFGGKIDEQSAADGVFWFDLVASDGSHFFARIQWFSYPQDPPSVRFVSALGTDSRQNSDWPICPGYRPDQNDICRAFTHEGFNTHPEWRTTAEAWRDDGNKFLDVVMELQNDLNHEYSGRHQ